MKVDIKDIFEALQKVQEQQGDFKLMLAIVLIVLLPLLMIYFKYYTKSIAEEASKKSLSKFESNLSEKLQTQMGLFFRDDNVRTNLLTHIGTKSIDKKIDCWQITQAMYFKYQSSWDFSVETDLNEFVKLDTELGELRHKIFNETIHIGYFLSQKMNRLNSLMRDNLRNKRTEFIYSGKNCQVQNENSLRGTLKRQHDNEGKISDLMYEIEKWIMDNLHSDQTIENFEFTKEQLEQIKNEREKKFDAFEEK